MSIGTTSAYPLKIKKWNIFLKFELTWYTKNLNIFFKIMVEKIYKKNINMLYKMVYKMVYKKKLKNVFQNYS